MAARLTTLVVVAIVAATLIAGLIVGAQRDDSEGPVDLIIHNAAVYTADAAHTTAEAVAIRGNQVLRVGSERDVMRLRRPQTTMIDAHGGSVLPGFNDAHVHFLNGGLDLERIDLTDAPDVADIQRRVRSWAEANPDEPWVLGRGWYYQPFADGLPTRQLLDDIVNDRPVQLISYDGHTSWVNSLALERAGITRRTANPKDGVIVKDPRSGEPTGVLKESAMALVARIVPAPTHEQRGRALRSAIGEAHKNGITSVQNAGGTAEDFEIYAEALRAGDLNIRVYSALSLDGPVTEQELARLEAIGKRYPDDPLFKTGAVKISLDGVVDAHTAALLEPYANDSSAGTPRIEADDLNRGVRLLDAAGWQVMTHAVGDKAVQMALNAYEHAARSNPVPERGRRHRIEHAELTAVEDVPRFGKLDIIASMQPFHGSPSPAQIEVWSRNVGAERASRGWAYRGVLGSHGHLAFGSDWPVVSLNPLLGLHTAVTRTTPDGDPPGGWFPEQRLALSAAIDAYTSGAAWASFDEQRKGTIAAGMLADLVVLTADIFDAPPADLAQTRVAATIFDGQVVYKRADRGTN
jgi:predicted amidohydrolase YtcJ